MVFPEPHHVAVSLEGVKFINLCHQVFSTKVACIMIVEELAVAELEVTATKDLGKSRMTTNARLIV